MRTRAGSNGVVVESYSTEDDDDDDSDTEEEVVVVIVVVVVVIVVAVTLLQLVEVSERTLRKHAALAGLTATVLLAAVSLQLVSSDGLATLVVPLVLVGLLLLLARTIASKLLFLSFAGMLFTLLTSRVPVEGDAAFNVDDELRTLLVGLAGSGWDREVSRSKLFGL